jgi:3-hydroxyacyl-[acyl-carrier-protein] dehydratase
MNEEFLEGLPHRPPFVFLDRVVSREAGVAAECTKVFLADDPLFGGHFPGDPIVPGVLLTEAVAQAAGIAASGEGDAYLLSAIRGMKFPAAARPGEELTISVRKSGEMGGLLLFEGRVEAGGRVVAVGTVVLNRRGAGGE